MVMLNDLDRFHLVMDVVDRVDGLGSRAACCTKSWPTRDWRPGATPATSARTNPKS
jgi:phosphoketolase